MQIKGLRIGQLNEKRKALYIDSGGHRYNIGGGAWEGIKKESWWRYDSEIACLRNFINFYFGGWDCVKLNRA